VDVDKREREERRERLRCVALIALIASCVFTTSVLVLVWSSIVLALPVRTYIASKSKTPQDRHSHTVFIYRTLSRRRTHSLTHSVNTSVASSTYLQHLVHAPRATHPACNSMHRRTNRANSTCLPRANKDDKQPSLAHLCICLPCVSLATTYVPDYGYRYVGRGLGSGVGRGGLGRRMEQRMMHMCRRPRKGMIRGDESGQ
jgi:hypothetical protein